MQRKQAIVSVQITYIRGGRGEYATAGSIRTGSPTQPARLAKFIPRQEQGPDAAIAVGTLL